MPAHDLNDEAVRTTDVLNEDNAEVTFADLGLPPTILSGLTKSGFAKPSPIQLKAVPYALKGRDLVVQAKSGTGKTCVYATAVLNRFDPSVAGLQGLVLAPTREIAAQGATTLLEIGVDFSGLDVGVFIGGMSVAEDKLKAKRCRLAAGTPGRIKQLISDKRMDVANVKIAVLDEADRLLDKNFAGDVLGILNKLPGSKQTLALSATYPEGVEKALKGLMNKPTRVRLGKDCQVLSGVGQFALRSEPLSKGPAIAGPLLVRETVESKTASLFRLLSSISYSQCIVFFNYTLRARSVCDRLNDQGWPAVFLAGIQDQRTVSAPWRT